VCGPEAARTEPGTRERQDLLQQVTSAGQFFWFTMGGGAMNCTDMLYAFERKKMNKQAGTLKVRQQSCEKFAPITEEYEELMETERPLNLWRNDDFKKFIR
jgi:hypothetical protein